MDDKTIKYQLTASIVLYEENLEILSKTIDSFLAIPLIKKLVLIDNSKKDDLRDSFINSQIFYKFIGENIGFGAGHNLAINKVKSISDFHLILNPDVTFKPRILEPLIKKLNQDKNLALITPKVLFPEGKFQHTCRRFPRLGELIVRTIPGLSYLFKKVKQRGEYVDIDLNQAFEPDWLHGCFLLFKTETLIELGGFDERYFLYMEDVDLCRRIDDSGLKKLYFPDEIIYHVHQKGSKYNLKLFLIHTSSAIKYFLKWKFPPKKP